MEQERRSMTSISTTKGILFVSHLSPSLNPRSNVEWSNRLIRVVGSRNLVNKTNNLVNKINSPYRNSRFRTNNRTTNPPTRNSLYIPSRQVPPPHPSHHSILTKSKPIDSVENPQRGIYIRSSMLRRQIDLVKLPRGRERVLSVNGIWRVGN